MKGRLSLPSATFGLQEAMPEVAKDMPASEKDMKPIAGQPRPSFAFNASLRFLAADCGIKAGFQYICGIQSICGIQDALLGCGYGHKMHVL